MTRGFVLPNVVETQRPPPAQEKPTPDPTTRKVGRRDDVCGDGQIDQARRVRGVPAGLGARSVAPQLQRVVVSRNGDDANQILTASYFDLAPEELEVARDDTNVLGAEDARLHRIAAHVDHVIFKGIFEVVEEINAPH
jgi:hypothetical protein